MAENQKGKRRSREEWRAVFDRFAASGLGVGAFCAREGISDSSFGRWRSLLGDAGQVTGTATAVERTGFVDAGRIGLSGDERIEVKLELGGGVVLHVVRG